MLVSLLALLGKAELGRSCRPGLQTEAWAGPSASPALTQTCPDGAGSGSSLGRGTISGCDLQVPSPPEASPSLGGKVMPCPCDAVTSFPRVFLSEDCSSNQDGDAAHYKLVRQRLCAPGPRQAVWEFGQPLTALDTRAVASEWSQPTGFVCPLPKGHRQTDTLLRLLPLPLLQKLGHAQTMSFISTQCCF